MTASTEHILQCNQSEPLANASGRIVNLMNENDHIRDLRRIRKSLSLDLPSKLR